MKVLLIGSEPVDYTIAFANGVAARTPVVLVVPKNRFAGLTRWLDPSIDVRLIDWPRHRSFANVAFLWRLTRLIRQEKPDIVHVLSNTVLWLNLAVPFWRSCPLVTTVHDVRLHPGDKDTATLPNWSPRLMVRQSPNIVVHGAALREAAAKVFGKPKARIHVLPHPAIYRYAELAQAEGLCPVRKEGAFTVLLFGRIFAYKGLDVLIDAERLLGHRIPGLHIVVAGRGDDPRTLSAQMGDLAHYDIRHRFIEDREVAQLFLDADMVVLPYREASQSGVVPVAATFGKPVVVTDVGELRTTVAPHGLGIVVPPGSPEHLANALVRMASDKELRRQCGENARTWADIVTGPAAIGANAAAIYQTILQRA